MFHHIQKSILDTLSTSEQLRYSELKPADLDGNVFGYHLKQVMSSGYVQKSDDGDYSLTLVGKNYIVNRYEDPLTQAHSIVLIVIRCGDQYLMRRRLVQPLIGAAGFIHGEPIAGEPLVATAAARLHAKTGLQVDLHVHSSGLITITQPDGTLASYSHAIVLTGETSQDYTIASDTTGEQLWATASEITANSAAFLPSCIDIIKRIEANNTSFFELNY